MAVETTPFLVVAWFHGSGLDWANSMQVYWLEQTEADVPQENDWLSSKDIISLDQLCFAPRRASWRLGRWTAKRGLAAFLNCEASCSTYARIEIRPALSGAPEAFLDGKLTRVAISLSHRDGRAFFALATDAAQLGCDLELIEPHSTAFTSDYFTSEEQAFIARQPIAEQQRLPALFWSAKEAALKALHEGLRLDTRSVSVSLINASPVVRAWDAMEVRYTGGHVFHGWWQLGDNMVRTIVAEPSPALPIPLSVPFVAHSESRQPR